MPILSPLFLKFDSPSELILTGCVSREEYILNCLPNEDSFFGMFEGLMSKQNFTSESGTRDLFPLKLVTINNEYNKGQEHVQ